MTRKARALGMTRTVYRNANGLPNSEQVTTARDQATLGRAIQERFPKYYRYFATSSFVYRGHAIRNHNRLLGNVEGVDGIKTGYTRASGFNLVTSMRRGNRHLVGVVLGGRSGGSRDAIMRNLLAENLAKGATNRTVAAITERSVSEANADVAEAEAAARPTQTVQAQGAIQVAAAAQEPGAAAQATRSVSKPSVLAAATAAVPPPQARIAAASPQARTEPAPLTSGVIQTQQLAAIPGVVGGLILDPAGNVTASAFPQVFSPDGLKTLARQLTGDAFLQEWLAREGATLDLRYADGHVLVRSTGDAWVLLLSSAETNGQLLGMALTQVVRRLKSAPAPQAVTAAGPAPSAPVAAPSAAVPAPSKGERLAALARTELGAHADKALEILARAGTSQADLAEAAAEIEKLTRLFISKKKAEEIGRRMREVLAG